MLAIPTAELNDPVMADKLERRLAAAGKLPPKRPGRVVFAEKVKIAVALTTILKPFCAKALPLLQETVTLSSDDREFDIQIKVADLYRGTDDIVRQILYRPAKEAKAKDRMRSAILHLGFELSSRNSVIDDDFSAASETRFHALSDKKQIVLPLRETSRARVELELLFDLFLEGLQRPLPFLPALSLPWYETWTKVRANKGDAEGAVAAREKVRTLLAGEYDYDAQDEAFKFCFQDRLEDDDFWTDFESLAMRIGPIFLDIMFDTI